MKKLVVVLFFAILLFSQVQYLVSPDALPLATGDYQPDFSLSADGDSTALPTFAETLDDDTMLYPDSMWMGDGNVHDYLDETDLYLDAGGDESLWSLGTDARDFSSEDGALMWGATASPAGASIESSVTYSTTLWNDGVPPDQTRVNIRAKSNSSGSSYIYVQMSCSEGTAIWYPDGLALTTSFQNITMALDNADGWTPTGTLSLVWSPTEADTVVWVDWVWIGNVSLLDSGYIIDTRSTIYAESFADISDWAFDSVGSSADYSFTSDGDVATMSVLADDANSEWVRYSYTFGTALSLEHYFEVNSKRCANSKQYVRFYDSGGDYVSTEIGGTDWTTTQRYLGSYSVSIDDVKEIHFYISDSPNSYDGGHIYGYFDYARIAPANEMGWQHDGSTTAGVSELTGRAGSISSDGNDLSLTADADGSVFAVSADTTSTAASIDMDYYPFFDASFSSITWSNVQLGVWGTSNLFQGTYNFGDQSGNTGTDIDFVGSITNYDEAVEVVDEYMNHEYVFHAKDDATGSSHPQIGSVDFEAQTTGTIEAYFNSIEGQVYFMVRDDSNNNLVYVRDRESINRLEVKYDGWSQTNYYYDTDTFRHIKIEFDTDANTVSVWCNGNNIISDETSKDDTGPINNLMFYSGRYDSAEFYLDAVGITGIDGYNVGDNLAPVPTADTLADFRNIKAEYDEVYKYLIYVDSGDTVTAEWLKAYSIANYTLTESSTTINDYLYVSDAVLYSSMTSGTIELNHDPSLSVGDTYSVWNLTTGSTAPEFSYYISSWTSYSSETRGSLSSGTVTDIKLRFDATEDISAITFIEDATAPNIVRSFANPPDPSDDESVTLSAVVTDAVEVYEVYFDAIVSPSGFTDTAYHAAEQTDNLWSYEFSSLTAGHYTFKIIATDGANENSLTEYAYIDLEIRTGSIVISPISFFGVGEDFTQMQMSFEINRDCSYTIYEASASYAISDTHTGSVSEGWSNIAWDKISVDDTAANFSIKFTNGSLSTWVNGSYSIAQTTFYVPPGWSHNGHEFSATVEVSGRITKLATYMIYTENAAGQLYNSKNGTLTTLDFQINFTRTGAAGKWHDFAIQFTNISQTCWLNSTYYIWEHNPDRDEKGGGGSPEWWNDAFWYIGIISVIGLFGIVLLHFRPQGGNLPNA